MPAAKQPADLGEALAHGGDGGYQGVQGQGLAVVEADEDDDAAAGAHLLRLGEGPHPGGAADAIDDHSRATRAQSPHRLDGILLGGVDDVMGAEAAGQLKAPLSANDSETLLSLAERFNGVADQSQCSISEWDRTAQTLRSLVEYSDVTWQPGNGPQRPTNATLTPSPASGSASGITAIRRSSRSRRTCRLPFPKSSATSCGSTGREDICVNLPWQIRLTRKR